MATPKITSTKGLRDFLVAHMEKAAEGGVDYTVTKGVSNLAQQIYNTINLELKVARVKAQYGDTLDLKPVSFE